MSKEQNTKRYKYELLHALADIRERYPAIHADQIERFSLVYYPIAMVEMLLEEKTFEDFETVQLTILRLMGMGITDPKVIATTLGLSAYYVSQVQRLLKGFGQIEGMALTDLGRQSLAKGQKVAKYETLQKFQVDALNGTLLKRDLVVADSMLNEPDETIVSVGHLHSLDGIDEQTLNDQFKKGGRGEFLQQRSGIIHDNTITIKSARFTELKYAKCCMLKLRKYDYPIIFAKRYNRTENELKKRYPWQPLSVHDARMRSHFGFEESTLISTPAANDCIMQISQLLLGYIEGPKMDLQEEVRTAMARFYPFHEEGLELRIGEPDKTSIVMLRPEAFSAYHGDLVSLLLGIHHDTMYLLTTRWLQGHVISFRTKNEKVRNLCQLLSEQVERRGRQAVVRDLNEHFLDSEADVPLVDAMTAFLEASADAE